MKLGGHADRAGPAFGGGDGAGRQAMPYAVEFRTTTGRFMHEGAVCAEARAQPVRKVQAEAFDPSLLLAPLIKRPDVSAVGHRYTPGVNADPTR